MAEVRVEIFKGGEIYKNITQTVILDAKNLAEFAKNLRCVQESTKEALQQLVESEKGGLIEMENDDDGEDEDEESERRSEKRRKEQRECKKKIRGK